MLCAPLIRLDCRGQAHRKSWLGSTSRSDPIGASHAPFPGSRARRDIALLDECANAPAGRPLDWDKLQVEILERYRALVMLVLSAASPGALIQAVHDTLRN